MSSIHKDCGENIRWVKRSDVDRWMAPLEFAGRAFVITGEVGLDSYAEEVSVYQVHHCNPEKMEAWQEYCAKIAHLKGEPEFTGSTYTAAKEREREQIWEIALKKKCPRCKQSRNKKCISMSKAASQAGKELRNPHPERLPVVRESDQ